MSKYGVNVPKGVVVSSKSEVAKVLKEQFPTDQEVHDNTSYTWGSVDVSWWNREFFLVRFYEGCATRNESIHKWIVMEVGLCAVGSEESSVGRRPWLRHIQEWAERRRTYCEERQGGGDSRFVLISRSLTIVEI